MKVICEVCKQITPENDALKITKAEIEAIKQIKLDLGMISYPMSYLNSQAIVCIRCYQNPKRTIIGRNG